MLTLQIPAKELYLPATQEFQQLPSDSMVLEHSLKSIAKWEGKTHRSFFDNDNMSTEDFTEYVRCMTIKPPKYESSYGRIDARLMMDTIAYMNDPMSARQFYQRKKKKKSRIKNATTVENIYLLMIEYGIPFDPCENWHFGRLMALIRTCEQKNGGENMSYRERQQWYNELNDARRKKLGTRG